MLKWIALIESFNLKQHDSTVPAACWSRRLENLARPAGQLARPWSPGSALAFLSLEHKSCKRGSGCWSRLEAFPDLKICHNTSFLQCVDVWIQPEKCNHSANGVHEFAVMQSLRIHGTYVTLSQLHTMLGLPKMHHIQ